jgi:DNA-binding XRE family transcriptional regulator/quercetin dioxygenase-like cupin family protein
MASSEIEETVEGIGPRLRSLRLQRGSTLAELAASTGISASTLSRLEAGQRRPTLELLLLLAKAHQVQLDELVQPPMTGDPRINLRPVKRNGMTVIPLSRRPGGTQAYKMIFPPQWPAGGTEQQTHEGFEWIYVLAGQLHLLLAENDVLLTAGEVAEFDTRLPHAFTNRGDQPAEVLILFGPQGERMHVRARSTVKKRGAER